MVLSLNTAVGRSCVGIKNPTYALPEVYFACDGETAAVALDDEPPEQMTHSKQS